MTLSWTSVIHAAEVTGIGSEPSSMFDSEYKQKARDKAKLAAWKKYVATFNAAKRRNYARQEKSFLVGLDKYIAETIIIQEKEDSNSGQYKVALRLVIDDGAVDAQFADSSSAGNQGLGMASEFGNVFIARVVNSVKEYDVKRTKISQEESESNVNEMASSSGTQSVESVSRNNMSKTASGGSRVRKRAKVEYALDEALQEELNFAVSEMLGTAGFEPMEYFDLTDHGAPTMDVVFDEMGSRTVMSGQLKKRILKSATKAGWHYFGIGTVDIGAPIIDGSTGLTKVPAKVSYKVWMIKSGKTRQIASVRPKQVFATAEDELYAGTEALNKATEFAMDTVIAQLQKKNVR